MTDLSSALLVTDACHCKLTDHLLSESGSEKQRDAPCRKKFDSLWSSTAGDIGNRIGNCLQEIPTGIENLVTGGPGRLVADL